MIDSREMKLYSDGGARGNPGPAACAFLICKLDGSVVEKHGFYIGETTNNQAEYQALAAGVERAAELGIKNLQVYMDSELAVKQLLGLYKVKNADLLPIFGKIKATEGQFEQISYTHVPRALNKLADAEVNRVLDQEAAKA